MAECAPLDFVCAAQNVASSAIGDAIENMANAVMEAFGKTVASLGTLWVNVGTPVLTGTGGGSSIPAGAAPPNADAIVQVLGWVMWIAILVSVASLIILGAMIATRMRNGQGLAAVGRLGIILGGIILIGASTALVAGLLPRGPVGAGGAVLFLQSALWWFTGALAVLSIIIGGARMAWEQRAEPGKDTLKGILTLIVVAGVGVTAVALIVSATDAFSVWIINGALDCDVAADSACFGRNISNLLALTTNPAAGGLGPLLIIIFGVIAILATATQIVLMIARGGMLVILTGILPLSAAAAISSETGKGWLRKNIAWLTAFILYKPAAAIVYATAFQLVGADVFQDDGSGLVAVLTGLILMALALFALPALMRFVTPLAAATAAGGGGMGAAALMALPTGAASMGRLATGAGSSSSGPGAAAAPGPSAPSGARGGGSAPVPISSAASTGARTTGTGAAAAAGGGSAAAGGGAAAGAAAGGGATAGAASGSAAGPWGAAAGVALGAAKSAGQAATGAARGVGEQATGEGGDR